MDSKVTEHMTRELERIMDETDVLRLAVWGAIPNIKTQSMLEKRKHDVTARIARMSTYLATLKQEIEALQMFESEQNEHSE